MMKFLVLTINTGENVYQYFRQYDWFVDVVSKGSEFAFIENNQDIVNYFIEHSTDICNSSNSNISIIYNKSVFELFIDEENPEFSYKGVSLEIIDMYIRKISTSIVLFGYVNGELVSTKASLDIDSGIVFDLDIKHNFDFCVNLTFELEGTTFVCTRDDNLISLIPDMLNDLNSLELKK